MGYEVPAAITAIEWLDEKKFLAANDKVIKVFKSGSYRNKIDESAV